MAGATREGGGEKGKRKGRGKGKGEGGEKGKGKRIMLETFPTALNFIDKVKI